MSRTQVPSAPFNDRDSDPVLDDIFLGPPDLGKSPGHGVWRAVKCQIHETPLNSQRFRGVSFLFGIQQSGDTINATSGFAEILSVRKPA